MLTCKWKRNRRRRSEERELLVPANTYLMMNCGIAGQARR